MVALITFGVLLLVLNVLDSMTTHIALHRLPDNLKAREGNPIAGYLMRHGKVLLEAVKHLGVLLLVAYLVYEQNIRVLVAATIMLGIVVVSNTFLIVGRHITKKRLKSPMGYLVDLTRIPARYNYAVVAIILVGLGWWLSGYIINAMGFA